MLKSIRNKHFYLRMLARLNGFKIYPAVRTGSQNAIENFCCKSCRFVKPFSCSCYQLHRLFQTFPRFTLYKDLFFLSLLLPSHPSLSLAFSRY